MKVFKKMKKKIKRLKDIQMNLEDQKRIRRVTVT